jgi:hypothetical protein
MKQLFLSLIFLLPCVAGDPWKIDASRWTEADAKRILSDSPWAKPVGRVAVTIRWESAGPVQLAKRKLGWKAASEEYPSFYAVAILANSPAQLGTRTKAKLRAAGRGSISSSKVLVQDRSVIFLFPRLQEFQEPIVFRLPFGIKFGNQVEFVTRLGDYDVKQTFSLRAMTYDGRPQL